MHVHTVFFWLQSDCDKDGRAQFEHGLSQLTSDPNVRDWRVGRPATTTRSVVDASYDYAMVLGFDDRAAHDRYQAGEHHQRFVKTCAASWTRVQVYDIDEIPLSR